MNRRYLAGMALVAGLAIAGPVLAAEPVPCEFYWSGWPDEPPVEGEPWEILVYDIDECPPPEPPRVDPVATIPPAEAPAAATPRMTLPPTDTR
jgi:hypothetical protein